ncbi:MAG: hypothetical protein methR_P2036 [Methyloprofundus sp.]|nr:MAG: hypothetical protein methR_P2036 [Methyloprofundus sp.]
MKVCRYLILKSILYCLYVFSYSAGAEELTSKSVMLDSDDLANTQEGFDWEPYQKVWQDDVQFHGFLSQGLFHSSGNNVFGKSKDSVSAGLTEIGLNVSYQALHNLSFALQGLYRRAGESTGSEGEVSLDYGFVDLTLINLQDVRIGVRGGRIKNAWGLYNETRDVSFTHPTIFLPLIYFERSRSMMLAMDGGQAYADYNSPIGDFSFKFNYGHMVDNNKELLLAITSDPSVSGHLKPEQSFMTQLRYEIQGGKYIFALSYADINMSYVGQEEFDPYANLLSHIYPIFISAQFNGEYFSLTGEYSYQWNEFTGFPNRPDALPVSEHWYIQGGYRILDNLELTVRYDSSVQDINDRKGEAFHLNTGLPAHLAYTQDWVVGLRWDITPAWMVRTEYHRVHGASMVSALDNPDIMNIAKDWNIYALQVSFRF